VIGCRIRCSHAMRIAGTRDSDDDYMDEPLSDRVPNSTAIVIQPRTATAC